MKLRKYTVIFIFDKTSEDNTTSGIRKIIKTGWSIFEEKNIIPENNTYFGRKVSN